MRVCVEERCGLTVDGGLCEAHTRQHL
jgi:hypothetical protein